MKLSREQFINRLRESVEAEALCVEPEQLAAHQVGNRIAALVCFPDTAAQIATVLRICADAEAKVVPWGGGTAMQVGNLPPQVDLVISTKRLNRLIEHDHANLTVTVQSGATVAMLQSALAGQKQFLPFDPPLPDSSTIGGVISANLNGPKRYSRGGVRDLVIGLKAVLGSGEQIKAGGKVVKNVAGYDLCKLFTGSLGTLAMLAEATLRLAPIPEESATAVAAGSSTELLELAHALKASTLLPSAVFLTKGAIKPTWLLAASFEGFDASVARQLSEFASLAQRSALEIQTYRSRAEGDIWRVIADLPLKSDRLIYRMTVPPSSFAPVLSEVENLLGRADPLISADLGIGTVWIVVPADSANVTHFGKLISLAQQHQGHAILFAAPPEIKIGVDVWGPAPPSISLMREIKNRFDPKAILNPGRFIGAM
jgi:glycolate oxidase FAD binding subunit